MKADPAWGLFTHLFRLPRQGKGTGGESSFTTGLKERTAYAVHDLIKAIYIGAPDKSRGQRRQDIHIVYDLVGYIPLGELMEEEMA